MNVEATSAFDSPLEELTLVKLVHGVLHATTKIDRRRKYTVKNSGDRTKHILIEQPVDAAWTLVSTKNLAEQSRDNYRFALDVPEHKTEILSIQEERKLEQHVRLGTVVDMTALVEYRNSAVTSPKVKAALAELEKRLAARNELATQHAQVKRRSPKSARSSANSAEHAAA